MKIDCCYFVICDGVAIRLLDRYTRNRIKHLSEFQWFVVVGIIWCVNCSGWLFRDEDMEWSKGPGQKTNGQKTFQKVLKEEFRIIV